MAASSTVLTDEGFVILAQIFCAFAQGSDGLYIDGSAILAAREDYTGPIERDKGKWATDGPLVLSLSRAMGKLAAQMAMADGKVTIDATAYRSAREAIHRLAFCPFFHAQGDVR
jgi:hypothetical protein